MIITRSFAILSYDLHDFCRVWARIFLFFSKTYHIWIMELSSQDNELCSHDLQMALKFDLKFNQKSFKHMSTSFLLGQVHPCFEDNGGQFQR